MDERLLGQMRSEVQRQARLALLAATDIETYLRPPEHVRASLAPQELTDRFWYAVQSFLTAAAMVSKLLWGVNATKSAARSALRADLGVSDGSVLKDRALRNTFEHFDERLEQFFDEHDDPAVDTHVGGFAGISFRPQHSLLRGFDPEAFSATYQGTTYALRPILDELRGLAQPSVTLGDLPRPAT